MIRRLIKKLLKKDFYILTDPHDGSITLSEDLYNRMQKDTGDRLNTVYMFTTGQKYGREEYGWVCNPETIDQFHDSDMPVATVQYNGKSKTIGFMATSPTLAMMYYEYSLPWDKKLKFSVSRHVLSSGIPYYKIEFQ